MELSARVVRSIVFTGAPPQSLTLVRWGGDEVTPAEGLISHLLADSKEIVDRMVGACIIRCTIRSLELIIVLSAFYYQHFAYLYS